MSVPARPVCRVRVSDSVSVSVSVQLQPQPDEQHRASGQVSLWPEFISFQYLSSQTFSSNVQCKAGHSYAHHASLWLLLSSSHLISAHLPDSSSASVGASCSDSNFATCQLVWRMKRACFAPDSTGTSSSRPLFQSRLFNVQPSQTNPARVRRPSDRRRVGVFGPSSAR